MTLRCKRPIIGGLVGTLSCKAGWGILRPRQRELDHLAFRLNPRMLPWVSFLACLLARSSITNSAKSSTISKQVEWRIRLRSHKTLFDLNAAMQRLHMPANLKVRRHSSMPFSFCSFVTMPGFCGSQRLNIRYTLPPKTTLVIFCQRLVRE